MTNNIRRKIDWISVVFLIGGIWLPGIRLRATEWTPVLDQVELLGVAGLLLGLWIGFSRFQKWHAHLIFLFYSIILPSWLFVFRMESHGEWLVSLQRFSTRINESLGQLFASQPVQDPVLFVVVSSILFWSLGYLSSFGFMRYRNPWGGLLPAAILFGVINFYDPTPEAFGLTGALLVFCLLMLAARSHWLNLSESWVKNGVLVERDAGESMMRLTVISSIFLILVAWNLRGIIRSFSPGSLENRRVSVIWRQIQRQFENGFVTLQSGSTLTGSYVDGLRLGRQTPTSQKPAFQVFTEGQDEPVYPLYWRVRFYDTYQNGMWLSSSLNEQDARLFSNSYLKDGNDFRDLGLVYSWNEADGRVIPFPGRITEIGIPFNLKYLDGEADIPGDGLLFPDDILLPGDQFNLKSRIYSGSANDLETIPEYSPDWLRERYLQIPETLPRRVRDLGSQIALGDSVFEKTLSITLYLRDRYRFVGEVPEVPSGQDPVDWFLFDQRSGFCNYFASAEVMLLRSVGIPARLAVGFSEGEAIPGGYQVRLKNAHAWPEVYFQDIGWIPFEPTVSLPSLSYGRRGLLAEEDLALQLDPGDQRSIRGSVNGLDERAAESDSNLIGLPFLSQFNFIKFFAVILISITLYYFRITRLRTGRIPIVFILVNILRENGSPIPGWLSSWYWFENLPVPAKQFIGIQFLSRKLGLFENKSYLPSEVFLILKRELPAAENLIDTFQEGFIAEMYSFERIYNREACKAAGAALQKKLFTQIIFGRS